MYGLVSLFYLSFLNFPGFKVYVVGAMLLSGVSKNYYMSTKKEGVAAVFVYDRSSKEEWLPSLLYMHNII